MINSRELIVLIVSRAILLNITAEIRKSVMLLIPNLYLQIKYCQKWEFAFFRISSRSKCDLNRLRSTYRRYDTVSVATKDSLDLGGLLVVQQPRGI